MPAKRRDEREVQDSTREAAMADLLGLERTGKRNGPDAIDLLGRQYELKTTTGGSVGTSRDVGHAYLDAMLQRTLVVLKGRNTTFGYERQALVAVTPREIQPWVEELRAKIAADEELIERAARDAQTSYSAQELERVRYLGRRGATRNNPKVPWAYILSAGVLLRAGHEAEDLAAVVDGHERGEELAELRRAVGDDRTVASADDLRQIADEATDSASS